MRIFGIDIKRAAPEPEPVEAAESGPPTVTVDEMLAYAGGSGWNASIFDGDKFDGGFGVTQLYELDYPTLRARCAQLFNENLYFVGLIRRLVTNEINTGLTPEAAPDEEIIGVPPESLNDWTETVENRHAIWARNPQLCDWRGLDTFGGLQRSQRLEALLGGDVLTVLRHDPVTGLPKVQLVSGDKVRTPWGAEEKPRKGNTIKHGVELDAAGRHVAFWVQQDDGTFARIPAWGPKSGRRLAWLVYGTPKRHDGVRGVPIGALVLQSLKELDRYRDSAQRKAVVNSMIALFIQRDHDKLGTLPLTGGVKRKETALLTDDAGRRRRFDVSTQFPGMALQDLSAGETVQGFRPDGTDINFPAFEDAITAALAWAHEIPPEILRLAFSNNYSASQAAINEFKIYLNLVWSQQGEQFCTPITTDWLIAETLLGKIKAPGFLDAWRDPLKYDIFGAWIRMDWYGSIKPSTDMLKQVKSAKLLVDEGFSTHARETRVMTGMKWSHNIKRVKRENELKVDAARPLAEFRKEFGEREAAAAIAELDERIADAVSDAMEQ